MEREAVRAVVARALDDLHTMGEYGTDDEADAVLAAIEAGHVVIPRAEYARLLAGQTVDLGRLEPRLPAEPEP